MMASSPGRQLHSPIPLPPSQTRNRTQSFESATDSDNSTTPTYGRASPPLNAYTSSHLRPSNETPQRNWQPGHRPRQHSQGFFEPSLPSATPNNINESITTLTTSQLAAQAAMHAQHNRKRSQTLPDPSGSPSGPSRYPVPPLPNYNAIRNLDGFVGGHSLAAAQAAAYPNLKSPQYSPGMQERGPPVPDKDMKPLKEKSKMKLFSKPKAIGVVKDKDIDRRFPALPSPAKLGLYGSSKSNLHNGSTTSLVDASNASLYTITTTGSTSTLVPSQQEKEKEKEKERKPHFLSRQKNKLFEKDDHHLPLSSASSISKATDPSAQPLYSFMSGALNTPSAFATPGSGLYNPKLKRWHKDDKEKIPNLSSSFGDTNEWLGPASPIGVGVGFGMGAASNSIIDVSFSANEVANLGASFGVPGITPDDAWPLLKARLLTIFEGEDPRPPIEDFNSLVSVYVRRCIQRRLPTSIIEDFNDLMYMGFSQLGATLKSVPDERLVPHLVAMWSLVFNNILPFIQAVFLPLDMEFKGCGPILSLREAAEFWGAAIPDSEQSLDTHQHTIPTLGEDLDVRRIVLRIFRDTIFLPRFDILMAVFSRLSLDSINASVPGDLPPPPPIGGSRPATANSNDLALSSLTSQQSHVGPGSFPSSSSVMMDSSTSGSGASPFSLISSANRSRATSNTSAGSWHSHHQNQQPTLHGLYVQQVLDTGARVTDMVGRLLQCVSVLTSVQSGDEKQLQMEELTKILKWNWLGKARTGRKRMGFVGTKLRSGTGNSSLVSSGPVMVRG